LERERPADDPEMAHPQAATASPRYTSRGVARPCRTCRDSSFGKHFLLARLDRIQLLTNDARRVGLGHVTCFDMSVSM
jgi:hypothetical protein